MRKLYCPRPVLLAGVILAFSLAVSAKAVTIMVTSAADGGGTCPGANCTLRQAIAKFNSDIITFAPGITTIELTSGELSISKNVTINGPGANMLTVKRSAAAGTPNFRIFHISGNLTAAISGMTISNGNAAGAGNEGGGIFSEGGTVSISSCAIYNNATDGYGGGVSQSLGSSKMAINNSSIYNNSAGLGAGGMSCFGGTLTINNCTISDNVETGNGGGGGLINEGSTITITNSTIAFNRSVFGGGIVNNDNNAAGSISARNTIVAKNSSTVQSPDVSDTLISKGYNLIGNNDMAKIVPTTGDQIGTKAAPIDPLLGPFLKNGGAIETRALLSGSTAIEKGDSGGTSTDQRGFARPVDSPNIANVGDGSDIGAYEVQADVLPGCSSINRVVKNTNDSGADSLRGVIASVCVGSTITFDPSVKGKINLTSAELLINKSLAIVGPGFKVLSIGRAIGSPDFRIFNVAANVNVAISGLTISEGAAASGAGGGIANQGTITLTSDFFLDNAAIFGGGGIHNNGGTATLTNCTIFFNSANTGAGGILNSTNSTMTLINSTLDQNSAQSGNGGGITNAGTLNLISSTVAGNSANSGAGGGIHNFSGTVTVRNSIIAKNTASSAPDYNGTLTSQGFNLIGDSTGTTVSPALFTDQLGTAASPIDPLIGLLDANDTRPLLPNSPAIDKGDSGGLTTDQRGFLRPIDLPSIANATGGDGADIGAFEVQATTLANISTRLPVQTGDNVLFAGFIVTGTQDKRVAVLAIGPSLSGFGVVGALANPTLELYSGDTLLESNDDWIISANKQAIIDSGLAPTDNLESAIIRTLPANGSQYTAIVRGVSDGTGIGSLQVYDLDANAASKLANISTRGLVQTGDNVLIAGTIVRGQTPQKVLVEALGPSTTVPGNLTDPTLELRDGNGTIVDANDNWVDSPNKQAIIDTTVPPGNNSESAIVATLPANGAQYTAIVRGAGGTTGVAVVQVFALN